MSNENREAERGKYEGKVREMDLRAGQPTDDRDAEIERLRRVLRNQSEAITLNGEAILRLTAERDEARRVIAAVRAVVEDWSTRWAGPAILDDLRAALDGDAATPDTEEKS